ncbi:sulfur carrier protein ThiS [Radiobacillus kanasensis]|uniref:sulfur carrier protein ThiS n=1 Tax=Radiobacillus kanasensis TaxID=2844358 RepID=UPI001E40C14E|nr:sulfur carrier protein ThiS [Radiobacillus kanasensis]UFT98554.1 sulfur carrier protein ThiS [Radiobacillus kanasensis]
MQLMINGTHINVPDTIETVSNLIEHLQLDKKVVIVECNQSILEKESHEDTKLCDGDRIELVHFVGGG